MFSDRIKIFFFLFLLAGLTVVVFYPAFFCNLTNWDDYDLIIKNPRIRSMGWDNLQKIFGEFYWYNYQPLTLLSLAIEYHFFNINASVIHFNNVLLHVLNVFLVFNFIRLLSGKSDVAFVAACLFAIHPMRVESVVWATERKDVLYAFFFLLALIQYVTYIQISGSGKRKHYLLALLFFILSCMSKGMAVSLSLAIIAVDYISRRKLSRNSFLDKIPFFGISLFFGLLVVSAVHSEVVNPLRESHNFLEKIQYSSYGLLFYLYKLFLPLNLSAFHSYPFPTGMVPAYYWLYTAAGLAITALFIFLAKFSRKILFGYGFFIATIAMVLQLKQTNAAMVADHYTYIPYIGFFFLAGEAYHFLRNSSFFYIKGLKEFVSGGMIVIIMLLGYLTRERIGVWQNSLSLWQDVVSKTPSALAYFNLGHAWQEQKRYDKALENFNQALKLFPYYSQAYVNRGNVKLTLGNHVEAVKDFKRALHLNPKAISAYINMASAKYTLKDVTGALAACDSAISIDPDFPGSYFNRATIHAGQKNYEKAYEDYSKAIVIYPYESRYFWKRGDLSAVMKKYKEAVNDYSISIQLDSSIAEVFYNRAMATIFLSDTSIACDDFYVSFKKGFAPSINKIYTHCKYLLHKNDVKKFLTANKHLHSVEKLRYDNGKVKLEVTDVWENDMVLKKLRHYDADGNLTEEGIIDKQGKYDGKIIWYYPQKQSTLLKIKISGFYKDTFPIGRWQEFYEDQSLMAEYSFENGKKEGIYKYYHKNRKLWTERMYKNNLLWAVISNYDSSGALLDPGSMKNGSGSVRVYDEEGKLQQVLIYYKGKRVR